MSKHTPGPWRVWSEKHAGRLTLLEVCETQDRGRHSHFASIAKHWPEAEANARLIAAAPDLLAALQIYQHAYESGCVDVDLHQAYNFAAAAIAKAEGVTP